MRSIRTKLVFWFCVLFVLMGGLIYLPLSRILPRMGTSQILKRDVEIARYLSNEAKEPLLINDRVELSLLLHDNLERLEDAQYLFIQGPDGTIISHTFAKGFPKGLLSFGLSAQYPYRIKEFLNNGKRMYDVAFPILEGELGTLHLGVSLESGKKDIAEISKINHYIAIVTLVSLGIGIFVFLTIGFMFSNQIIRLKNFASKIGEGDLEARIDGTSKDEIGALSLAFNEMASKLKEKIQEIKRLNVIEERNKIAFDLHDGWAQHAANIIKRLELCEKLFEMDPQKAFKELGALKESTKDNLNWTRQLIFDFKSPEHTDFNLLNRLTTYIMDYRNRNDIHVKLDVSGPINIQENKAKSIFYIITEALANVRKHSKAKNVEVYLDASRDSYLRINVKDDGEGFDIHSTELSTQAQGKWGLISMRQRAEFLGGSFNIESALQQGTKISIQLPLGETET